MEKSKDGKWHKVEDADAYGEEYKKYDQMVIGRALVLSKLEGTAILWATTSEKSFVAAEHSYVDVAGAFNKKMADVIHHWRRHVEDTKSKSWKTQKEYDGAVDMVVNKMTRYMELFKAKEVELSPECKKKWGAKNDDVWEPEDELKKKKCRIDNGVETGGMIVNPRKMRCIHRRAQAVKDSVEDLQVGRSEPK